jgi:hypothetical protein
MISWEFAMKVFQEAGLKKKSTVETADVNDCLLYEYE